ncbi:MAG: (2Fe-2S)-binding protein [Burkholderiales bacterium]
MFKTLPETAAAAATVTVLINGVPFSAPFGCTAAAALLLAGSTPTRTTPVSAAPRAPYCMMGVCFECLVEIDGAPNQQACMMPVADGMRINRQAGSVEIKT